MAKYNTQRRESKICHNNLQHNEDRIATRLEGTQSKCHVMFNQELNAHTHLLLKLDKEPSKLTRDKDTIDMIEFEIIYSIDK